MQEDLDIKILFLDQKEIRVSRKPGSVRISPWQSFIYAFCHQKT